MKKKVEIFKAFLENLSTITDDKELLKTLTEGFEKCYPSKDSITAFVECGLISSDVPGAKKIIEAGMDASKIADFDEYMKSLEGKNPEPAFEAAISDVFGSSTLVEAETSKLSNLMKILALSAGIASGAHAADADTTTVKAPTQQFQNEDDSPKLDDVLKSSLGDKAMHYIKGHNAKTIHDVKTAGEKAKPAVDILNPAQHG